MSWLIELFRTVGTLWIAGLARTAHPPSGDDEADREAWEREREQLALSPWWL